MESLTAPPPWRTTVDTGDPTFSRYLVEIDIGFGWMPVGVIHESLADGEPAHFRVDRLIRGERHPLTETSDWTDAILALLSAF